MVDRNDPIIDPTVYTLDALIKIRVSDEPIYEWRFVGRVQPDGRIELTPEQLDFERAALRTAVDLVLKRLGADDRSIDLRLHPYPGGTRMEKLLAYVTRMCGVEGLMIDEVPRSQTQVFVLKGHRLGMPELTFQVWMGPLHPAGHFIGTHWPVNDPGQ